ncbi:plant intracellular Ras-group-related LRR protein 7-like isoform X2 [Salvia splendens]|uniref:plant intracellular Ras-group-related LRR protein 7-like isoform X2 n=1 Tax=Salvia splendens TaxID=180675 RepID=UPI001C2603D9|nr:plant intracellular Ras-group-related LRR protein 7-like isoform X2 [Salvia splendens]
MGCCTSKSADSKASRAARWRSTGIVALRDSKLKVLTENVIECLPMNLGKLQYLKVMALDGNRITTLPDEFGQLVKLEKLSISRNLLLNLPETIGSLRNLMLLDVSNNKIKFLPESIGSCFSLEEIQANENSIEELPLSVCNLVHLKSLSLDNNTVKQIPPNLLKDCKSLQNISLHGNPISMDDFQQMEGFEDFEGRRKRKFDKLIDSNVMINSKGLDEGVDL